MPAQYHVLASLGTHVASAVCWHAEHHVAEGHTSLDARQGREHVQTSSQTMLCICYAALCGSCWTWALLQLKVRSRHCLLACVRSFAQLCISTCHQQVDCPMCTAASNADSWAPVTGKQDWQTCLVSGQTAEPMFDAKLQCQTHGKACLDPADDPCGHRYHRVALLLGALCATRSAASS